MTRLYVPSPLYHNDPFHTALPPLLFRKKEGQHIGEKKETLNVFVRK